MMIDKEILDQCRSIVKKELGNLDDFPKELANTFVNIYYKFFEIAKKTDDDNFISQQLADDQYMLKTMRNFSYHSNFILVHVERIREYVLGFREAKIKAPHVYDNMVHLYLDILKYRIKNVQNKSRIRRNIERTIYGNRVDEIPNLIDMIR